MYDKIEYYLISDPAFEEFYRNLRAGGWSISFITRDSFNETVKIARLDWKVFRGLETVVGSRFDCAVDKRHHYIIVTADVPKNFPDPPLSVEKGQQLNLLAHGHSS